MSTSYVDHGDMIRLHKDFTHILSKSVNPPSTSATDGKEKLRRYPINEVPDLKVQEALIFKDLLYVLIGLEGNYIRYSKKFDPSSGNIAGPNYNITKHLDPSLADITKRLSRFGAYYFGLSTFVEYYSDEQNGKTTQSLCFEIRQLLKEYLDILTEVEHNFNFNTSYSLRLLEQDLNERIAIRVTYCYELVMFIYRENKERSQYMENHFASLILDIKNDLKQTGTIDLHSHAGNSKVMKGGLILKIIEKRLESVKGDPVSSVFLTTLFDKVSRDYTRMLNDWLLRGEINDVHDEFVIKLSDDGHKLLYTESYWDKKFTLRKEGLIKQFLSRDVQYKILLTGKYLNILKECGVNVIDIPMNSIEITSLNNHDLYLQIDNSYKRSNQLITDMFFNGLNFISVLKSLKRFYLLDNIHNFNQFLNLSVNELKKNKNLASEATLQRYFFSAFASEEEENSSLNNHESSTRRLIFAMLNLRLEQNNVYDYLLEILSVQPIDSEEVLSSSNMNFLKTLLNKTLETENHERPTSSTHTKIDNYAINRFNIKIYLPFPLNLIITESFLTQYELISRHLMIIKFIDHLLEISWSEICFHKCWIYTYRNNKINKWILKTRLLHARMKDFLNILQFYLSYDVIQTNWVEFQKFLEQDCNSNDANFEFESVYTKLQTFINVIFTNSCLTMDKLINLINKLFSIITLFSNFVNSLRKTLILLDEDLFNEYESKMSDKHKTFDEEKNNERFIKLNNVLNNYAQNFNEVLREFDNGLQYHGETECFAFLLLHEKLALSKLI